MQQHFRLKRLAKKGEGTVRQLRQLPHVAFFPALDGSAGDKEDADAGPKAFRGLLAGCDRHPAAQHLRAGEYSIDGAGRPPTYFW